MEGFDNEFKMDTEKERKKKTIIVAIIACIVIIIVLAFMVIYYKSVDAKTFKLWIDDQRVANIPGDFYIFDEEGHMYINAKEVSEYTGWKYQNGEFGNFTESTDSGYLMNDYEASAFTADSTTLKKYIQLSENISLLIKDGKTADENGNPIFLPNSENGTLETVILDLPVKLYNDEIYFPFDNIRDIANININYMNNKMYIYTQKYLTGLASVKAGEYGCTEVSSTYENIRALAYGMLIAKQNNGYGVINLYNGESILGFKYTDVVFCQGKKEFIVKAHSTDGDTVGIVNYEGKQVIPLKSYENINVLSSELGLYIVEKNNKLGVLNSQGNVVAYNDYTEIGLDEMTRAQFGFKMDDNKYMLYDNIIVVQENGKYGLIAIEEKNGEITGKLVLDTFYTGLGYSNNTSGITSSSTSKPSSSNSSDTTNKTLGEGVLTIPVEVETSKGIKKVKGIVVELITENSSEALYGVFDAESRSLLVPCGCTKIYSKTKSGETTYYMEYAGQQIEFKNYIKEQVEAGNIIIDSSKDIEKDVVTTDKTSTEKDTDTETDTE